MQPCQTRSVSRPISRIMRASDQVLPLFRTPHLPRQAALAQCVKRLLLVMQAISFNLIAASGGQTAEGETAAGYSDGLSELCMTALGSMKVKILKCVSHTGSSAWLSNPPRSSINVICVCRLCLSVPQRTIPSQLIPKLLT